MSENVWLFKLTWYEISKTFEHLTSVSYLEESWVVDSTVG